MRRELDLYANVRPVAGAATALRPAIDMVIVRENTECLYVKRETLERDADGRQRATAVRVITEVASTRIARAGTAHPGVRVRFFPFAGAYNARGCSVRVGGAAGSSAGATGACDGCAQG
jgi:hypothetical protein